MKKILLIGATGSIGEKISQELSVRGHEVYGVGRKEEILDEMKKRNYLREHAVADIITSEGRGKIIQFVLKYCPNLAIYAQGILDSKPLVEMDDEEIDRVVHTNLTSIIKLDRDLLKSGYNTEKIIYLDSFSGLHSWGKEDEGGSVYEASKTGLMGHVSAMRMRDKKTTRIAVYPDTIATERGMSSSLEQYPKIPINPFVEEFSNIVEGKYSGSDFLFLIWEDNTISFRELLIDKETNRPTRYNSKIIKTLGNATL